MRSDGFVMFPSAEKALLEFGGLEIDQQGPGLSCSREPFEINPTIATYEGDRFKKFATVADSRLYPLGEAVTGHCFVAIAENESVYLLMDDIRVVGRNIDEGLEALLVGLQPSEPITRV